MPVRSMPRFYWDMFIIIFAIYNSISLPLSFAFIEIKDEYRNNNWLFAFDKFADCIFVIDIILGFMTTFINTHTGDEIWAPSLIARKYLRTTFFVDFLSICPLLLELISYGITDTNTVYTIDLVSSFLGMFKIIRIRRISNIIANINQT